jgi:hypothetical protein
MASALELTTSQHLPDLTGFLLEVFRMSADAPFVRPEIMRWKYFEPRPDWLGTRSYSMFRGGHIFAHGCVVPVTFRTPSGRVTSMRVIDWAGGRTVPAAGVLVMRKMAEMTDTVLAIGGSPDAVRVFPKMGFEDRGSVGIFVRVVRPWRQFRTDPYPRGWKAPLRLGRSMLWSRTPLPPAPKGWTAERVERFDGCIDSIPSFEPKTFTTTERSDGMLNYMLSHPDKLFSGFLLRQGTRLRGHFMLSHVCGQTRIAEARVDSEQAEDWQAAINLATLEAAKDPRTSEIVAVSSIEPGREAIRRNGYRYRRQDTIFVLDPKHRLADAPQLDLNLLAGDESYLCVPSYPFET